MAGIFHEYYTAVLAPAIAAVVAIGGALLWSRRERAWARLVLAVALAGTALWAWVLLGRSADFLPWLRWAVLVAGPAAAVVLLAVHRLGRAVLAAGTAAAVLAGLGGPVAYAVQTAVTPHVGAIPTAGPAVSGDDGFGPGAVLQPGTGGPPPGTAGSGEQVPGPAGAPGGGDATTVVPPGGGDGGPSGPGGLLGTGEVSDELAALLAEDGASYTWAAATVGSNDAAGYQLATGLPVMPVGGFNASDPSPTLEQFQQYVADGEIHWFIGGGLGTADDGDGSASAQIAAWVAEEFTARTVDGVTVYDLTRPVT
ncbi:hypothetical protein JD79_00247 [Geodermatophilus normandii]|uniref:Putative mannosyltransferase YkcA/B-like C-terminal domain-containing protein n=1 Tax=Geodermatophilus normandii TaxID=1137989 RepID=A0A317QDK2_9ACTN|nr:hypothetical protein JD79_00247 [Geodermatophilus normandii]